MEQLGPLPGVDAVLNKLKSNGTFDQFRKTCLSSIEGEPSFRAYSEHIEVVSRRYLQNYKWRESTTKNQVRGKLKDHAIGVIAGPDIQVGMPLASVVEKVLETQSKELLPKITEIVDQLREAKSKESETGTTQPTAAQSSSIKSNSLVSELPKPKLTEFGSLPIDIPGLNLSNNSSKKEQPATVSSDGKTPKSKSKASDVVSSKEPRVGGPVKSKPSQGTGVSSGKPPVVKESGKQKDKDKDEKGSTSNKGSEEITSKPTKGAVKPKKVKDEVKENPVSDLKEEQRESTATIASDSKEKEDGERKDPQSTEQKNMTDAKSSKPVQTKGKEKDITKEKQTEPSSDKQPATTRRSARLASLTESKDGSKKDEEPEGGEQGKEDHSNGVAVAEHELENEPKRKGKKRSKSNKNSSHSAGRKRARMISSSSDDDSKAPVSSEDEEQLNKDDKKPPGPSTSVKGRRKSKDAPNAPKSKSSRKRSLQQSHELEPAPVRRKKRKTKSNENEHKSPVQESPKEKEPSPDQLVDSKPNKRKSKQPQRLPQRASKSPPVVITRYNRHVKPNRRYLDTSGNEAEAKSDDEGGPVKEGDEAGESTMVSGDSDFEGDNEGSEAGYSSCDEEEERTSPANTDTTSRSKTVR